MPYVNGTLAGKYKTGIAEIGRTRGELLESMAAQILRGSGVIQGRNLIFEDLMRMKVEELKKINDDYLQPWEDGAEENEIVYEFLTADQQNRFLAIRDFIEQTIREKITAREKIVKEVATPPAEPSHRVTPSEGKAAVSFTPVVTRQRAHAFLATEPVDELVVKKNEKIREVLHERLEKVRKESKSTIRDDRLFSLLAITDYILKNYSQNKQVIDLSHVEDQVKKQLKKDNAKLEQFARGIDTVSSNPLAKIAGRKSEYVKMKEEVAKIKDLSEVQTASIKHTPKLTD
jgi:hypothetical protein